MPTNFINYVKWANSLEGYNLPKLTQEKIDSLNTFIAIKVKDRINNCLLKQKAPGPDGFTGEVYKIPKKEIIAILYNLFQKTEANMNKF